MYETGGIKCPVISFEKYLSKRNKKSGALFQYPIQRLVYSSYRLAFFENTLIKFPIAFFPIALFSYHSSSSSVKLVLK
jgi:hypothetical protein